MKKVLIYLACVAIFVAGILLVIKFSSNLPSSLFGFLNKNVSRPSTVKLVVGMPQVPVYPESKLVSSTKETLNEGDKYQAVWQSADSVSKIAGWYRVQAVAQGWLLHTEPSNWKAEDLQYVVFKKNDNSLNLSLERNKVSKMTSITIEVVPAAQEEEAGE